MADNADIDFSALKSPDYVGTYVNAFRAGRALGGRADPAADPAQALRARIAGMSPAERARAGEQADLLAGVGQGLKSIPYTDRAAILAHMTPALAARGVPPAALAAFDPTDENLDGAVAEARAVGSLLGAGSG